MMEEALVSSLILEGFKCQYKEKKQQAIVLSEKYLGSIVEKQF